MSAGGLTDPPWGRTLAGFAHARRSGELVVQIEGGAQAGQQVRIELADGELVAAASPFAADSVVRIALTGHLIAPRMIAPITARLAAAPGDEVAALAEVARLPDEQARALRRRVLRQRLARTFAIERGTYRLEPASAPATGERFGEIAAAIYAGAHLHLTDERLGADTRKLGTRFQLDPGTDLAAFGFTSLEQPVLDSLGGGATLAELDARHREISPRTQQAVVYALVTFGACTVVEAAPVPEPAIPRTATPRPRVEWDRSPAPPRTTTISSRTTTTEWERPARRPSTINELAARAKTTEWPRPRTGSPPPAPALPRTITPRRSVFAIREAVATKLALLEEGADHYALLGLVRDATPTAIRTSYLALASLLHRDKLPPTVHDDRELAAAAQRVFAAVGVAFAVLSDPARRTAYDAGEPTGPPAAEPDPARDADAEFQRGVRALRREDMMEAIDALTRATVLVPEEVDYAAMLAWARFCASSDKRAISDTVRKALERAVSRSAKPMMARFYLGRVERILGRTSQALYHFREVLAIEPGHADAAAEVRFLERAELRNAQR